MSAAEAHARALKLFERVRIPSPERRLAAYPHEMSGGMPQRAMIALALACRPQVLLGEVPSVMRPPSGCRFHPRCPRAEAVCAQKAPSRKALALPGVTEGVACLIAEPGSGHSAAAAPDGGMKVAA